MKTFFTDIIPKLKKYSNKLDNLSLLTNQHWVVLNDLEKTKVIYIFRENKDLLVSTNGKVDKAKWEYLGNSSILIDLKEQSYLFKQGFFDENILALKVDNSNEFVILINETKYNNELNSIESVNSFLNKQYVVNPLSPEVNIKKPKNKILNLKYKKSGYSIKMGRFMCYIVTFKNKDELLIYKKESNNKYYFFNNKQILLFPDKETCIMYIEREV